LHTLFEFVFVQGFVVIIVDNLEFSTHADNASGTSCLESVSDKLKDLFFSGGSSYVISLLLALIVILSKA